MPDQPKVVDVWFVNCGERRCYVVFVDHGERPEMFNFSAAGAGCYGIVDDPPVIEYFKVHEDTLRKVLKFKLPPGHGVLSTALDEPADLRE